ncbi:MAG: ATP-binding protein [Patescibacteria group bacterium]
MDNVDMIPRTVEKTILKYLWKGKIIIIYGARQVGKTTLVKTIIKNLSLQSSIYLNCDENDIRQMFIHANTSTQLKEIIGNRKLVVIDEAQRIPDIGLKLKLLVDAFPSQQIIATGSSSFDLANTIVEPLTGRNISFWLYPFSISEIQTIYSSTEIHRILETFLIYGTYPAVIKAASFEEKQTNVSYIANNYLYKDIFKFQGLKASTVVTKLLQALALQIGSEVSYNELAGLLGIAKETVASYINLLEQAFVIFTLPPFSNNKRKELHKLRKIYFYDTGIRNALINNFNPISLRNDIGQLWENYSISERQKKWFWLTDKPNFYFWRTYDQQEVDLIEEKMGKIGAFEIKWKNARLKPPKAWRESYPKSHWTNITKDNFI